MASPSWNRASIQHLLRNNDAAVVRALLQIYARQTAGEKRKDAATELNGRGFTAPDAFALSSIAKCAKEGFTLTDYELGVCRKLLMKYTRQLLEIIVETQLQALTQ